jgi:hypothetical protein
MRDLSDFSGRLATGSVRVVDLTAPAPRGA